VIPLSEDTNGGRTKGYQALRESEELHRTTLSNISDAVFLTDDDGAFTYISPNVDIIFGYVPDEVQAMSRINRLLGDNLYDRAELVSRKEIRNIEREITTRSGERRTLLILLKSVSIRGGTVLYCCRDITERKQAEEELRAARFELAHASRLALVGELMSSVTHEISQPLMSIAMNADTGLHILDGDSEKQISPEIRDILADIRDQSRVASDMMARIRTLVTKQRVEFGDLDINDLVSEVLRLTETEARRRGVTPLVALTPAPLKLQGDRVGLKQVFLNLILNAMDAMDQVEVGQRRLLIQTNNLGNAVEIVVSDNGTGIPTERLPRVFDAFFTTKPSGMGLGLAVARSIVESHRGRIRAENHEGHGATFRVTLPVFQVG
jgi:PAS domain S-box-containing protein